MKKIIEKEIYVCDFCLKESGQDVPAIGKVQPTLEDACEKHLTAYAQEVRLPQEKNREMSGFRVAVAPGYEAQMVIEYKNKDKIRKEK